MNLLTALLAALRALGTNWLRSMLTMLGIIIGVAAVITMIAIGGGAQARVEEQMKSLGTNIMLVLPGAQTTGGVRLGAQTGQTLTEEDARAIAAEVPEVQAAAPSLRTGAQVVAANANWSTSVMGTTPEYLEVRDWPLAAGRSFDAAEMAGSGKVVVIGQTVAQQLFGDADPIDQVIRVRKAPLQVIGVLERKGQNSMGQDQDDVIVVPLSTFRNRVQGMSAGRIKRVGAISVKIREGQSMTDAGEKMRELLRQRHRLQSGADDDFSIRNLTEMLQAQEESSRVMALLLAAVAGVSLVVGGIGIMNIMLVSVTERTREIGLRMAVGARSRDILGQFLIEAVTMSLVGGAIGIVLGMAATWAIGSLAGWQVLLSASRSCWRWASRPRWACSSASIRRAAPPRCCRSRRCAMNSPARWLALACCVLLAGCAGMGVPRSITLGEAELQAQLARRFPMQRSLLDTFELQLSDPKLRAGCADAAPGHRADAARQRPAQRPQPAGPAGAGLWAALRAGRRQHSAGAAAHRKPAVRARAGPVAATQRDGATHGHRPGGKAARGPGAVPRAARAAGKAQGGRLPARHAAGHSGRCGNHDRAGGHVGRQRRVPLAPL